MPVGLDLHPEALSELEEATSYYLREAPISAADQFSSTITQALEKIRQAPTRWRIVEEPGIRRYILRGFPYLFYYRWESANRRVIVYAVMHGSRRPGYWHHRLDTFE